MSPRKRLMDKRWMEINEYVTLFPLCVYNVQVYIELPIIIILYIGG